LMQIKDNLFFEDGFLVGASVEGMDGVVVEGTMDGADDIELPT